MVQQPRSFGRRVPLEDVRPSITTKFEIQGMEIYITVGLYPDGRVGEIFTTVQCSGDCDPTVRDALPTIRGLLDGWAVTASIGFQYGVPLRAISSKLIATLFPPDRFATPEEAAKLGGGHRINSILDYIARWFGYRFDLNTGVLKGWPEYEEGSGEE